MRILLIDELAMVRENLRYFLNSQPDCVVVAGFHDPLAALEELRNNAVDIIVLCNDPGAEGSFRFLRQHRKEQLPGKIVCLIREVSRPAMFAALEAGVKGIVLQYNSPERLVSALHEIQDGMVWIDAALQDRKTSRRIASSNRLARPLTSREQEVYRAILDGLTNKEIGERLGTSEIAVKASLQHIFAKTGVRTRTQLVRMAMESESSSRATA